MKRCLIIYGVFEHEKCIMVGSTEKSLQKRAQQYRRFKWFDDAKYNHRVLWEGMVNAEDDEHFRFLRAAKETKMICQMKTWYNQGGKNQTNPLIQALGMPYGYGRSGELYGSIGGKIGGPIRGRQAVESGQLASICRLGNAALPREARVRGGCTQGMKNAKNGHMANIGKRQGEKNAKTGHLREISHLRWHVNRGIIKRECSLCQT